MCECEYASIHMFTHTHTYTHVPHIDFHCNTGGVALMLASQNGHIEVLRTLLSAGAKVDLQNKVRTTSPSQGPVVTCALM